MTYQISKYDAVKAALKAEEANNIRLANKLMYVIRRAARHEIQQKSYDEFYVLSEREKKYFENAVCGLQITVIDAQE